MLVRAYAFLLERVIRPALSQFWREIGEFYAVQKRRATALEALKLRKDRSGREGVRMKRKTGAV